MDSKSFMFGLLFITVFNCQIKYGHSLDEFISILSTTLADNLFQQGHLELLGHTCQYTITPKFRKWRLKYSGKLWCPGWTTLSGRALRSSSSSTIEHAMRDYIDKALAKGYVNGDDVKAWMENFNN